MVNIRIARPRIGHVHQYHKMFSRSGTASYAGRGGEDYGPHVSSCHEPHQVREHLKKKKNVFFRALPGLGGTPLPEIFLQKCKCLNSELDERSKLPV